MIRRTKRLLVIGTESYHGEQVFKGIHQYCSSHGHWDYHMARDNSAESIERAINVLNTWKVDGIIAHILTDRVERLVKKSRVPSVCVSASRDVNIPTVISDNVAAGRLAAQHFLNRGFRSFAFHALGTEKAPLRRGEGFVAELTAAGFKCEQWVEAREGHLDPHSKQNHRKMSAWLKSLKKPVGLLCGYDIRGQQVAKTCENQGIRIPEEIALVGVGNAEILCLTTSPRLSSVELDIPRIGFEAAQLVDRMIHRASPPKKPILIPPIRVITRESSEIIALDDPVIAEALQLIRNHADQPFNVKELMQKIAVSRRFLEKRFRQHLGRTPAEEIMRVRLDRAKALLRDTDMAIPAVAERSGFTGREIFAAVFRRELRLTPTMFRRRFRLTTAEPSRR